ncbi:MAG TPA: DUF4055 domain-containing protein [Pseudomonadales bacterium]|nr:DUF4055 domain-containing protein [Pseudomonadales bacterium]
MAVSNPHPEYQKYLPVWTRTRDAVKGSRAVKEKKHQYLPVPDNTSGDEAKGTETIRYRQYIKRAVYTNFTGRTKNALVGAAFRKQPNFVIPDQLGYLLQDATGDGLSLVQLAKDELSNLLETGRTAFLVDYPATDENLSAEQVARLRLQANIIPYTAEQVVNWRTQSVNGRRLLVLVVLAENYSVQKDEFDHTADVQYRVLRLREDGYTTQIYRDDKPYGEEVYPTKADGSRWMEIPFQFVGAKNNDSTIDEAPLADIADVNMAHYRNSADYEESCFLVGQPSLFITHSLSAEQWKQYNPQGIKLGSRSGHVLGDSGSATLLQANPNQLVMEAMKAKENAMVSIGARIITDRAGNETAEGARIRFASENSVLGDLVDNLSEGIEICLQWVGEFMGIASDEIEFDINTEFYDKSVDPQLIMSMVTLMDRDIIGEQDIFDRLKSAGVVDPERTLEDVREERGTSNPLI